MSHGSFIQRPVYKKTNMFINKMCCFFKFALLIKVHASHDTLYGPVVLKVDQPFLFNLSFLN